MFSKFVLNQGWVLQFTPFDKLKKVDNNDEEEYSEGNRYNNDDKEQDNYNEDEDMRDDNEEDDINNNDEEESDDNEDNNNNDNDNENELNLKNDEKNPQRNIHEDLKPPGHGGIGTTATGESSGMAGAKIGETAAAEAKAAAVEAGAAVATPAAAPLIFGCLIIIILFILLAFIFSGLGEATEFENSKNNITNLTDTKPVVVCGNYAFPIGDKNAEISYTHHSRSALDVPLLVGTNLYAITSGTAYLLSTNRNTNRVIKYNKDGIKKFGCDNSAGSNMGIAIEIKGDDGYSYRYLHLSEWDPKITSNGVRVATGEYIGKSGNSGCSTGPHLHLDIRNKDGRFLPGTTKHGFVPENWDCGERGSSSFQVQCDSFKIFMDALKTMGPNDTCPSPGT